MQGSGGPSRRDACVAGEGRGAGEPACPSGSAEQTGSGHGPDPGCAGERAAGLGDELGHLGGVGLESRIDCAKVGDQVGGQLNSGVFGRSGCLDRGEQRLGAGRGQITRSATGQQRS